MNKKTITFKNNKYQLEKIIYSSGRTGIMMKDLSGNGRFNATIDFVSRSIKLDEVIIRDYGITAGLYDALVDHHIVDTRHRIVSVGLNKAYVTKLLYEI